MFELEIESHACFLEAYVYNVNFLWSIRTLPSLPILFSFPIENFLDFFVVVEQMTFGLKHFQSKTPGRLRALIGGWSHSICEVE